MRYLTFMIPLLLLFTACGGSSSEKKEMQTEGNNTEMQGQADQSNDMRTIDIVGVNQMKFVVKDKAQGITTGETVGNDNMLELTSISVKPGEKIQIRLTAKSKLPASAMSHNFIVLKRGTDAEAFDQAATKAKDNDYIPSDMSDKILAHTDLASGGKTVEVTFTAPQEKGENEFICSFPGHYASGMKGTLVVE